MTYGAMGAAIRRTSLCCLLLAAVTAAAGGHSDTASLLARANDLPGPSKQGSTKTQRSVIYRDDYPGHPGEGYGGHDSAFPFEMRPPFASGPLSGGLNQRLNVIEYPEHKYVTGPKHGRPPPYRAPVYVPQRPTGPIPGVDPFLAGHQRVTAQFESEPPAVELHLVPEPAVHHAPPPPPPPPYHAQLPYAHEFPYSEHEQEYPVHRPYTQEIPYSYHEEEHSEVGEPFAHKFPYSDHEEGYPAYRQPYAKALGGLNPQPFIATIANAYQENEKNFGEYRQGKLEENALVHGPKQIPPLPAYRELPMYQWPAVGPGYVPGPQLGPLYALAAAGSAVSTTTLTSDRTVSAGQQA